MKSRHAIRVAAYREIVVIKNTAVKMVWALMLMQMLPPRAIADAAKPTVPVAANPLNMMLGLIFLLALVIGGWWLVRRAGGLQIASGNGMKVIAALAVGPRERVVLIELAGEQWLLGVAPGQVSLLHRFEKPVLISGSGDFAAKMRQVLQQGFGK